MMAHPRQTDPCTAQPCTSYDGSCKVNAQSSHIWWWLVQAAGRLDQTIFVARRRLTRRTMTGLSHCSRWQKVTVEGIVRGGSHKLPSGQQPQCGIKCCTNNTTPIVAYTIDQCPNQSGHRWTKVWRTNSRITPSAPLFFLTIGHNGDLPNRLLTPTQALANICPIAIIQPSWQICLGWDKWWITHEKCHIWRWYHQQGWHLRQGWHISRDMAHQLMVDTPTLGGDNLSALGELNTTSLKTTQWHCTLQIWQRGQWGLWGR